MTLDKAKSAVLAKYPTAKLLTWRGDCGSGTRWYVIIDGTTFQGRWLTGKHRSELAAWTRAAKEAMP